MGGWEKGGVGGAGRWVAGGGLYLSLGHRQDSSVVSSVSDRNRLNPQDT